MSRSTWVYISTFLSMNCFAPGIWQRGLLGIEAYTRARRESEGRERRYRRHQEQLRVEHPCLGGACPQNWECERPPRLGASGVCSVACWRVWCSHPCCSWRCPQFVSIGPPFSSNLHLNTYFAVLYCYEVLLNRYPAILYCSIAKLLPWMAIFATIVWLLGLIVWLLRYYWYIVLLDWFIGILYCCMLLYCVALLILIPHLEYQGSEIGTLIKICIVEKRRRMFERSSSWKLRTTRRIP